MQTSIFHSPLFVKEKYQLFRVNTVGVICSASGSGAARALVGGEFASFVKQSAAAGASGILRQYGAFRYANTTIVELLALLLTEELENTCFFKGNNVLVDATIRTSIRQM